MDTQEICGIELPKKIRVGSFDINIVCGKDLGVSEHKYGEYSPHHHTIKIGSECNQQQAFETFFHEVVECIDATYRLDIEHHAIKILGIGLAQALDSEKVIVE